MITLKQLSEICGTSVSTVSKAINGRPDVNPETAERIRQIANSLGYHPNAAARSLKTNRSYNIGVLFADHINHEYFANVLDSIRDTAMDFGYDITFICNRIGTSKMSFYRHAAYRYCDGVVIAQARFEDPFIAELVVSDLHIVVIEHVFSGCVSVMSENVRSMVEIIRYVAGMGHRKIAFIHGEERGSLHRSELRGFTRAVWNRGFEFPRNISSRESTISQRKAVWRPEHFCLCLLLRPVFYTLMIIPIWGG